MLKKWFTGFWVNDPKTWLPSASLTLMMWAFIISTMFLILSQVQTIGGITFRQFTTADAMTYVSPFLALYFGRRWTTKEETQQVTPSKVEPG